MIKNYCQIGSVITILLFVGCATAPVQKTEIIWPLPPDPPRIKFVKTIESAKEVEKESFGKSVMQFLVGKDPTVHLQKPYAVHADRKQRVYVADSAWRKILVMDYAKKEFMFLGLDGPGILSRPMGVTTDFTGNIYVSDTVGKRVVVYDPNGKYLLAMGGKEIFEEPVGIAVNDKLRRVYVVDTRKHNVDIFDFEGRFLSDFGGRGVNDGQFNFPTNLAVD
ncbi:MAG: hypothetical protein HY036_10845, partial [Nitrospirae bacterium]|nr:hypothetical protein [Nitrospirota bacterium]